MLLYDWFMLALLLHCLKFNSTVCSIILNQWSMKSDSVSHHALLDQWLTLPTKDIAHLKLLLRKHLMFQDAEHVYTQWFLKHTHKVLTVLTYNETLIIGKGNNTNDNKQCQRRKFNRDSYIIVTSMEQFEKTSQRFLQRAGKFFFIISNNVNMEQLYQILQIAWLRLNVFKNFILTRDHGILYFDPFEYDNRSVRYGKLLQYTGEQRLERLLFTDMRGYPLRVQIFRSVYAHPKFNKTTGKIIDVIGVDGEVARLLEQRMNFSLLLQDPDPDYFGERAANGSYNGAIGAIIRNDIDMCLTGFFIKDYMVPEMDFTVAVYDDQLCIYVPKASRVPQSILPIFAVSYNLWASFILTGFVCANIWSLFRLLNLQLKIKAIKRTIKLVHTNRWFQLMRIYIDTWVVWVRVNIVRYPPFHSERIFLGSLCLVSVIFGAIFESSLATVYIHPMHYKDINTLRELDKSELKIIYKYSSMADDLFFSETSLLFANLNKKLTHMNDLNADVMLDVAQNRSKAGVTRYTTLMLESLHFIVSKRIWVIPECPKYYTISYVLPKDSPWEEGINNLLLRFNDAGLFTKWINDMEAEVDRKIIKDHIFEDIDTFKVLTVADLQLAFYVVFMGSFIAIACLIAENVLRKWFMCCALRDLSSID